MGKNSIEHCQKKKDIILGYFQLSLNHMLLGAERIFQKYHYVPSLIMYSSLGNHHHSRQAVALDLWSNLLQLLLHLTRYKKT